MPNDRGDLCSTCLYSPSCVNRGRPAGRVFECEEFFVPGGTGPARRQRILAPQEAASGNGASRRRGAKSEGLCFDCGNRPSCGMKTVEGGVWHCEEYC
jgi:hypothetical protein